MHIGSTWRGHGLHGYISAHTSRGVQWRLVCLVRTTWGWRLSKDKACMQWGCGLSHEGGNPSMLCGV